jgi:isoleucyl-tRNA synthetase
MVRWLAPILSFTAEEVWGFMPGARNESVFLNAWHQFPAGTSRASDIDWPAFIALKTDVARQLERLRTAGQIGAPLEAEVTIYAPAEQARKFSALGDELRFLLITSQARVVESDAPPPDSVPSQAENVWIRVKPSTQPKCVRCWHLRSDVGSDPRHPELCARCIVNIDGPGEERKFA